LPRKNAKNAKEETKFHFCLDRATVIHPLFAFFAFFCGHFFFSLQHRAGGSTGSNRPLFAPAVFWVVGAASAGFPRVLCGKHRMSHAEQTSAAFGTRDAIGQKRSQDVSDDGTIG